MQSLNRQGVLLVSQSHPSYSLRAISRRRPAAGSGGDAVENGPVERGVDDLVVGHVFPRLNTFILYAAQANGYGAKSGALQ